MTVSTTFQTKIDLVDNTKTLTWEIDETYGESEWSYDTLHVKGGTDEAIAHGLTALLYALGFRFYAPHPKYHILPGSIATDLTAEKQENFLPICRMFIGYNFDNRITEGDTLQANFNDWLELNAFSDSRAPLGHSWDGRIGRHSAYLNAQDMLFDHNSFDLGGIARGSVKWNNMVMVMAGDILNQGLDANKRTTFDPSDSDHNDAHDVFRFTKDVVDQVRAGTDAIATLDAQDGVADAQLGIYCYGNHSRYDDINFDCTGIYGGLATAYLSITGHTLEELLVGWGDRLDFLTCREYWGVFQWDGGAPRASGSRDYFDYANRYDLYKEHGIIGVNGEHTGSWLKNLVNTYNVVRKARTGVGVYSDTRDEIIAAVFNDDDAVRDLYTSWNKKAEHAGVYSLKQYGDIITQMADSGGAFDYKESFQQYVTHLKWRSYKGGQTSEGFEDRINQLMGSVYDRDYFAKDDLDCYAFSRQTVGTGQLTDPTVTYLRWNANPPPDWFTSPSGQADEDDFDDAYAVLQADGDRLASLDSVDFVLARVTPENSGGGNEEGDIWAVTGGGNLVFIGPGTLMVNDAPFRVFPERKIYRLVRDFEIPSGRLRANGGYLFADAFNGFEINNYDQDNFTNDLYMYVPQSIAGSVDFHPGSRTTVHWNGGGSGGLLGGNYAAEKPYNIPGGQLRLELGNSRTFGGLKIFTPCPYLSPYPNLALLPRELAEAVGEFPSRGTINSPVAPFVDETFDTIELDTE